MSVPALASNTYEQNGLHQSAHLMRALGAKAAPIWSQLSPREAEQLSAAMQALPDDANAERKALKSFVRSMQDRPLGTAATQSVWDELSQKEGTVIAAFFQGESPQVIAVVLSRIAPNAAANTVRAMPKSLATEALKRLLSLGDVHPAALKALEGSIGARLEQMKAGRLAGGHEHVARIFDSLDGQSENNLLSSLDSVEPGSSEKIRAFMFTFEDLAALDPGSLQTILGNVDRTVLTLALKGASTGIADAFFKNITQRAAALLKEEIEATGPVRRSEIDAARSEVLQIARSLVKRGDLLPQDKDDELIE